MTAYARLVHGGPETEIRCDECDLLSSYPRTAPAQAAARDHNRLRHAYPEQTLTTEETT